MMVKENSTTKKYDDFDSQIHTGKYDYNKESIIYKDKDLKNQQYHDISLHESFNPAKLNYPLRLAKSNDTLWAQTYWHEQMEIIYFKEGNGTFLTGGVEYYISPGDIYVINCNSLHYLDNSTKSLSLSITIDDTFFKNTDFKNVIFKTYIPKDDFLRFCFDRVFDEYEEKKQGWDMAVLGEVYTMITHLIRNYRQNTLTQSNYKSRNHRLKRLHLIINYISLHYNEKISTSVLSEIFHINKYYLCKNFKAETGQTLVEYINGYRIKRSLTFLENTTESIEKIAETVGFDDANYFSRIFKKSMGITPGQYRKKSNN